MAQEIDKAFIRKFIAGECTPHEQERMKLFMQQPGSQKLLDEVIDEDWQGFRNQTPATDDYIMDFQQRLNKRIDEGNKKPAAKYRIIRFYRYAAIWAILILGAATYGVLQLKKATSVPQTIAMISSRNPYGQRSTITLPDGSIVTLGAASSITYPHHFKDSIREISLQGEAFFEITKNPRQPFIVHSGEVQVKVLGTSFKIDAFKGEKFAVAVATGKVQVSKKSDIPGKLKSIALLLPGDVVAYDQVSGSATRSNVPPTELTGWKNGKLTFTGTPLSDVVKILERWYNIKIEIRNKHIAKYKMNIQLDGTRPLNQSLDVLQATTKAGYSIKNNTVIIQ